MAADRTASVAGSSPEHPQAVDSGLGIVWWRRRTAGVGVVALLALAAFGTIGGDQIVAGVAFVALAIGTVLAWVELGHLHRHREEENAVPVVEQAPAETPAHARRSAGRWSPLLAIGVTAAVALGAVQTWFTPGTAIAQGDVAPPNGTAWLGQLFSSWTWSGSDLGRPGSLETQLPWAGLLWLVHSAGGSAMLAQRLWYTLLFTGAALGALWLLRLLRASWTAATVGALLYLFNPFVLSNVGTNAVFLAALVLVVVEPAIVVSVCSGRWRGRTGVVGLVATVPLIGYAYENPPLVLAVAATGLAGLVVSVLWFGDSARRRAVGFLALGVPLAALVSLYWVVPSLEQLHFDAIRQLSALSSWTWTENRSTLANAFWLNTSWAWPHKEYVPYNGNYSILPLSMLRYAFPIVGFAALTFRYGPSPKSTRRLGLAASGATGSLLVIFLSTGTRLPGSLLFDPLYSLPYGWLLLGPGRFLLLAGVGYAVMAVVTLDTWMDHFDRRVSSVRSWSTGNQLAAKLGVAVAIVGAAALAPGYPLAFGAVAPGPRPGPLPSTHVRVPRYWTEMASYLNGPASPPGNLLVLPPDPFYQMLYTWGYYGNDGFITDMIRRNVLVPSGQGYGAAGGTLMGAVDQVATSLLAGDDTAANRILSALGTSEVLVRGDIAVPGLNHPDSPKALAAALRGNPGVELVHRSGPLSLFRLRSADGTLGGVHTGVPYVTSETAAPNLLALAAQPAGTAIVRHAPISGVPAVVQVPSELSWKLRGRQLRQVTALPPGRTYTLTQLGAGGRATPPVALPVGVSTTLGAVHARVQATPAGTFASLSTGLGHNELADGEFEAGQWQRKVGNCDAAPGTHPHLVARLGPPPPSDGGRALVLSANGDIACEAKAVAWHGGPVLLTLSAQDISGGGPAICLWEIGPNGCASLPALGTSGRWQTYQQVVTPPSGTQGLSLFLYAGGAAGKNVDAYAAVSVRSLPVSAPLAIVATDPSGGSRPPVLTTADSTFSAVWTVNGAAQHVLVNGLANGWLSDGSRRLVPRDTTTSILAAGFVAAFIASAGTLLLAGSLAVGNLRARRGRRLRAQR